MIYTLHLVVRMIKLEQINFVNKNGFGLNHNRAFNNF